MAANALPTNRLVALDVFRGLTIALMFIVNNPGTWSFIYAPWEHAYWHGVTPTDWVFPFFLFAVGISAWYSLKKYENRPPTDVYLKILKRGATIFLIGLALNAFLISAADYSHLRIMGVLQRIGICYIIGSIICVSFNKTTVGVIGGVLLVWYHIMMHYGSDPQFPYGLEVMDGDGVSSMQHLDTNLVTEIDKKVFGENHLWRGKGTAFDPEGLLSTIPAIVTVILGYFAGRMIDMEADRSLLVRKMLIWGAIGLATGWLLSNATIFGQWACPINKSLWTPTYVLNTGGTAIIILAILIWFIDIQGFKGWTKPVLVLGMNSILAFVLSGVYVKTISKFKFNSPVETVVQKWDNQTVPKQIGGYQKIYENVFSPITTPDGLLRRVKTRQLTKASDPIEWNAFVEKQKLSSFLFAIFHVLFFWFILWIFYIRGIFLKV
jgi:predicted acyltransferase